MKGSKARVVPRGEFVFGCGNGGVVCHGCATGRAGGTGVGGGGTGGEGHGGQARPLKGVGIDGLVFGGVVWHCCC